MSFDEFIYGLGTLVFFMGAMIVLGTFIQVLFGPAWKAYRARLAEIKGEN